MVVRQKIEEGANSLGCRFVLAIKNKRTDRELFKARYVFQGHLDKETDTLVHNASTVSQQAVRLLISMDTIFGFQIWSEYMTQAYLQGAEKILRKVYIKGKPEFQLDADELLEILRPLYGLADSGDFWQYTFRRHMKKNLCMTTTACDLSLHFKRVQRTLQGIIATNVDDNFSAGQNSFKKKH